MGVLSFMLNPARKTRKVTRRRSATKRKIKKAQGSIWGKFLRASGGNAKMAKALRTKFGTSIPRTVRARLSRMRPNRAGAEKRAAALRRVRKADRIEREAMSAMALNPRRRKKRTRKACRTRVTRRKNPTPGKKRNKMAVKRKRRTRGKRRVARRTRRNPMYRVKRKKRFKVKSTGKTYKGGQLTGHKRKNKTRRAKRKGRGWSNNPRRVRSRRRARRNPAGFGGILGSIKRTLTSSKTLVKFGVGAASAVVCGGLGSFAASKIREMAKQPMLASDQIGGKILDVAAKIAVGVVVSSFVPAKYREAVLVGAGIGAVSGVVRDGLKAVVPPQYHGQLGLSGWVSAGQLPGLSGYIGADQASRLGLRGVGQLAYAQ